VVPDRKENRGNPNDSLVEKIGLRTDLNDVKGRWKRGRVSKPPALSTGLVSREGIKDRTKKKSFFNPGLIGS